MDELQDTGDWQGVVALEKEALALARELRGADSETASAILNMLGVAFQKTGDYGRARELLEQERAMAEALGDRAGVARACGNLGLCYEQPLYYASTGKLGCSSRRMQFATLALLGKA